MIHGRSRGAADTLVKAAIGDAGDLSSKGAASGRARTICTESTGDGEARGSVQISGEQYSFTAPGISVSFGSTNGEAKLELTNDGATRAVRVAYTGNGEPQVFLDNLPTADPGETGALWDNAGVVNISS